MSEHGVARQLPAAAYKRLKRASRQLTEACGGCLEAAKFTRLGKTFIHDCGNPDKPTFLPIDAVADMESECGKPIISVALADLHHEGARPHRPADPLERVSELAKETGEACWSFHAHHKRPSLNAANDALKELQEARDAIDAAMKDIEADMEAGAEAAE